MAISQRTVGQFVAPMPLARNAQAPLPTSCPNCGAPVRWRTCDYCRGMVASV